MSVLNFFDILIIILFIRAIYLGRKIGLMPGLFFLFGVITANFFAIHYYTQIGKSVSQWFEISSSWGDFVAFLFLNGVIIAVFTLVRNGWQALLRIETATVCNYWSGLITTTISYILISGLLFLSVFILRNNYLMIRARNCFSYRIFGKSSIRIYEGLFNFVVKPIFPSEKINDKVFKVYAKSRNSKLENEQSNQEIK